MKRIAVTGATGFVGRHLVAALQAEGHEVRGMSRSGGKIPGLSVSSGDVRSREDVAGLLNGRDCVIHLASSFSPEDDTNDIVTLGTRTVVDVASHSGVKRIIYVSCLGAEASAHSDLLRAKWQAEMILRGSELPFVILRPSLVVGRGDGVLSTLAALVRSSPVIPLPAGSNQRTQPIDVDDLVRCLVTSLSSDEVTGEAVPVGGPFFVSLRYLVDLVCGQLGVARRKILLPHALFASLARVLPLHARLLYGEPRLSVITNGVVSSPLIVQRMFGFTPKSIVEQMGSYLD